MRLGESINGILREEKLRMTLGFWLGELNRRWCYSLR